jgi:PHP family Zn ribbon phosphoesterase
VLIIDAWKQRVKKKRKQKERLEKKLEDAKLDKEEELRKMDKVHNYFALTNLQKFEEQKNELDSYNKQIEEVKKEASEQAKLYKTKKDELITKLESELKVIGHFV